jgi:hypothetical protein
MKLRFFAVREERRSMEFEKRIMRIFEPERKEVTEEQRK